MNISNVITQVKQDDDEEAYDGGISARKFDDDEEDEYDSEEKPSLLRRIFCCFFTGVQSSIELQSMEANLLPPQSKEHVGKKTLLLDLDETLVHSSFKPVQGADFVIPVEIEHLVHKVYVTKRPGVDNFLKVVGDHFEVAIFTASLALYANPVIDLLDIHQVVKWRLFRDACTYHKGNFVKDLSRVGRPMNQVLIVDNSPASFMFQPENAIEVITWFDDMNDNELSDLAIFLKNEVAKSKDVRKPLKKWKTDRMRN